MKRCPTCNRTYTDPSLNFCLEDGSPLIVEVPGASDPNATIRYAPSRDTGEPPPTEIYRQEVPVLNQVPEMMPRQQQWSPTPIIQPKKRSGAVWWVLGGIAVIGIIGVGMIVMLIAVASLSSSNENSNSSRNDNSRTVTRDNSNSANGNNSNANASSELKSELTDDFSQEKWGTGSSKFGDLWYADGEYHMRSKEKTFVVMYAPDDDYNTENATVRVTARNVDGKSPSSGYGLMVHGEKTKSGDLEDYGLLIYTGEEPQYEIVMHKNGDQSTLVPWTKSTVIRSGTTPNQLEIRVKGTELSFYINGQYLTQVNDSENFRRGRAGLYTSDTSEVAFDDLEIRR